MDINVLFRKKFVADSVVMSILDDQVCLPEKRKLQLTNCLHPISLLACQGHTFIIADRGGRGKATVDGFMPSWVIS